ncbi:MAG: GntR family transcriptional regulator [Clostridiaceae bacterium]
MDDTKARIDAILDQNPFLSMHRVVYLILREDILNWRLSPNQRLKETELAERFDVSRTTIRRTLETLKDEEWVTPDGKQGVKVVALTIENYYKFTELRIVLDTAAIQLAAINRTEKELAEMRCYIKMADTDDFNEFYQADAGFHRAIYEATQNSYFIRLYDIIGVELARIKLYAAFQIDIMKPEMRKRIIREHQAILEAIEKSDAKEAYESGQKHTEIMHEWKAMK